MPLEVHTVELKAKDGISPVMKSVSGATKQAMGDIQKSTDQANESHRKFSAGAAAMGVSLAAATGILQRWTLAAAEDAANQERLQVAVENAGASYNDFSAAIDKAIAAGQRKAFGDDATRGALVKLNAVTNDTGKSISELSLAMDFARARGIDLGTSADIIGKVMGGNTAILARYGIQLDKNATSEQALAELQRISAGQAQAYADSDLGKLERRKDQIGELTEAWGAHAQALTQVLGLMPGITAGYTALSGVIAGIGGMAGLAGLGPALGILGIAGAGYLAYDTVHNANAPGGSITDNAIANIVASLPGVGGYGQDELDYNNLTKVLSHYFYIPPGTKDPSKFLTTQLNANGLVPQITGDRTNSQIDISKWITDQAKSLGLSLDAYIRGYVLPKLAKSYTFDPATSQLVFNDTYTQMQHQRWIAGGVGLSTPSFNSPGGPGGIVPTIPKGPYDPFGWMGNGVFLGNMSASQQSSVTEHNQFMAGGFGAVANSGVLQGPGTYSASQQNNILQAALVQGLGEQNKAYAGLAEGINNANDAQMAFKATQDNLLGAESQYSGQISEYTGQVNSLKSAHDLLAERQKNGIELTKQQQDFMNNYDEALQRGTGGIEDATIAQGMLSEQYLLNMEKGDQMNAVMGNTASAVGDLKDIIEELILSMDGIPPEVKSKILIERAAEERNNLQAIANLLNAMDGRQVDFYVNAHGNGLSLGTPGGPTVLAEQLGGMVPHAAIGRMLSGYTLVGEDQPELIAGGQGGIVIPGGATRAMRQQQGASIVIQQMVVYADNPQQFSDQMRSRGLGEVNY